MATKRRRGKEIVPVYHVDVGSPEQFKEDIEVKEDRYTYSSHGNRKVPEKIDEIFVNTFMQHLKHTPFEPDEVELYRYGMLLRPRKGEWNKEIEDRIREVLSEYPGSSMHIINEGEDTRGNQLFSIKVNLGSKTRAILAGNVEEDLNKNKDLLTEIYAMIVEEYGQLEWFAFFETEEQIGYE